MFGLIWTIIATCGHEISKIDDKLTDEKYKTKYRSPDGLTYIDHNGRTRLVKNNKLVIRRGDKILYEDLNLY